MRQNTSKNKLARGKVIKQIIEFEIRRPRLPGRTQGLQERGSVGTSYPGPGLRGPGRVQVAALRVAALSFGPNLSEEPKLSEDLSVFLAIHLVVGKKIWDQI